MALDKEYFESINIELVKKKYYNANKVNAVFEDIRRQAESLSAENQALREQLEVLNGQKAEIGDAVMSAQTIYKDIVDKANACAAAILSDAQRKHDEMSEENARMQDYAVKRVGVCVERLRAQQQKTIEIINAEWQSFLCDLDGKPSEAEVTFPDIGERLEALEKELTDINETKE